MSNNRIHEIKEAHEKEEKLLSEHPEWRKSAIKAHKYIGYLLSEYDRLQEILIGQNRVIEAYGRIVRDMESDYVEILERISQSSMSQYASVEDMVKGMKLIASTALSQLKGGESSE